MDTTTDLVPGATVTFTFLPGHALERTETKRLFELGGQLVVQGSMSDDFITVVLRDGSTNPNLRIDSVS